MISVVSSVGISAVLIKYCYSKTQERFLEIYELAERILGRSSNTDTRK